LRDEELLKDLKDKWKRWLTEPAPDHLFEIAERSLVTASPRRPAQPKQELLGEQGLAPSPSAPNLIKPEAYRQVLPRLDSGAAARRSRAALVIPDYAVRMAILDFEDFPAGEAERLALVRFRFRKSVPFPIDEAQLSYAIQLQQPKRIEVLAVAIARPILEEYEAVFTEMGYRIGLVMPSSIAALPLCSASDSGLTVLAKASRSTLTVLLLEGRSVRLVRCVDLASDGAAPHSLQDELALLQQTIAYAEDQIGEPAARLLLCGFGTETDALGKMAEEEFGLPYATLRSRFGAPSQHNAGLLGLLEQYAA
jgi:type IV pilus assembly protein PilM